MQIPARILRAEACDLDPSLRQLTIAQEEQRDRILDVAQALMVRHGPHTITFGAFARALKIGTATLRRYFCDLDELLAIILTRHLTAISRSIGDAVRDAPKLSVADLQAARRAAYMQATRGPFGGFTPAHFLFTAYHHLLPPDELEPLQATHLGLACLLCPDHPYEALALLDAPALTPRQVEAALPAIIQAPPMVAPAMPPAHPDAEPQPQPETQPETSPEPPDPDAPIVMCTRTENLFGAKHPDDVYILAPKGHATSSLVHAPLRE